MVRERHPGVHSLRAASGSDHTAFLEGAIICGLMSQPVLILLPGAPDSPVSFECSDCGQLFLTDSEYSQFDLNDDFARHLRTMHTGQYSIPITYEVRLAQAPE